MLDTRIRVLKFAVIFVAALAVFQTANAQEEKLPEPRSELANVVIHVNQVGYDIDAPKFAVIESKDKLAADTSVRVISTSDTTTPLSIQLGTRQSIDEWFAGRYFYRIDFSRLNEAGNYHIQVRGEKNEWKSTSFDVADSAISNVSLPAIIDFFQHQRANSPQELNADQHLLLFGSDDKRVDLHGGWCDASGDISKYFSHLAYTNFMTPQQTPLVVWSMVNAAESAAPKLDELQIAEAMRDEALYGADYLRRSLAAEGYFYMTIFSYFKKDPEERRVVGLLANSKTTSDYQAAFREGAGLAIAALARISTWQRDRDFTASEYLYSAERAFNHLQTHNLEYADDGKENIIDDYGALLAATELWIATDKPQYRDAARKRATNLANRLSENGYFIADDDSRPFWHAADAGLPIVALVRYLDQETDNAYRSPAIATIKKAIDAQLKLTNAVTNPFGYPRQTFRVNGQIREGFFIPHENESGWWWQGENARLSSLATAVISGGRITHPGDGPYGISPELGQFASTQLSWILGANPYDICFMYQYGHHNVPYMESMFGHGSGKGGISNGITGKDGRDDGSGIDFRFHAGGDEWRWTEQWIPHSAWYLQAVTAISSSAPKRPAVTRDTP
ncbi:glycoside hydrolase family 9 protein [Rhodopirellula sp. MGV]|uniref:glycoside hydrolase family 9 protein n=1 Tax=Rhodopirellula sp. MGV TaxID=2023130 RepID=UPI000B95CF8C|nr:glycoside hydrolase family 9 protein [Rhodopirellula sp. MGV]OYP38855.1 glycosyl transferase [Rhodopirellula sp. MGV]PNY37664.1 glycosyl transferase [Rhodopirellula baltica]